MNISTIARRLRTARQVLSVAAAVFTILFAAPAAASPASGYWWNPANGGSGFVLEIQGNQMFMAGFLYSANGNASWVASSGAMSSATQYSGSLITYSGGQTLTGAWQAASPVQLAGGSTIAINFTSDTTATITWPGGTDPIQRFDIVAGGSTATEPATNPQTGWWWNTAEGGRGFAIEVQNGQMYLAGYMYDQAGNATWYLANGAMTNEALFQGEWTQYANGPTLTGPYKQPNLSNGSVGTVSVQFTGVSNATMTLPNGRQIPLERFNFSGVAGPQLASVNPTSAAPASVITLTGTNIDPTTTLSLTLSDSTGYSVSIPLTTASTTSLTASVPPYINPATGAFGSGTVNIKLTQTSGSSSVDSNILTGFTIQPVPVAKGTAGQGTLSLIRANLASAQKLQTAIKGTAQDSVTVDAAITTQIADLQTLVTNVQGVVQNGVSFQLGAVGGVNITVSPSNISDVDNLILATLQTLATPPAGTAMGMNTGMASQKTTEAVSPTCLSAEAEAFVAALLSGTGNFDALAQALVDAPGTSAACGTVTGFTSAYQIFGGAGGIGIGISDGAGTVPGSRLPGAALFATANANADTTLVLEALLSAALATESAALQNAVGGISALSQAQVAELLAKASGAFAANLTDSSTFINIVAPPPSATLVPVNLPTGTYTFSFSYNYTIQGNVEQGSVGPIALTNVDAAQFASLLETDINSFNSSNCGAGDGVICSATVTPFNGTTFQVVFLINGPGITGNVTYILTKTG